MDRKGLCVTNMNITGSKLTEYIVSEVNCDSHDGGLTWKWELELTVNWLG